VAVAFGDASNHPLLKLKDVVPFPQAIISAVLVVFSTPVTSGRCPDVAKRKLVAVR